VSRELEAGRVVDRSTRIKVAVEVVFKTSAPDRFKGGRRICPGSGRERRSRFGKYPDGRRSEVKHFLVSIRERDRDIVGNGGLQLTSKETR